MNKQELAVLNGCNIHANTTYHKTHVYDIRGATVARVCGYVCEKVKAVNVYGVYVQ